MLRAAQGKVVAYDPEGMKNAPKYFDDLDCASNMYEAIENADAIIIVITHHIEPQDLIQTAYIIKYSFKYFPERTVHVVVVDPGVGSDRAIIALEVTGHIFLAPDNGVLTLLSQQYLYLL